MAIEVIVSCFELISRHDTTQSQCSKSVYGVSVSQRQAWLCWDLPLVALRRGLRWRRISLAQKFSKIAVVVTVYKSLLGLVEGCLVYTDSFGLT